MDERRESATSTKVLVVVDAQKNLIFIGTLTDRGYKAEFSKDRFGIRLGSKVMSTGKRVDEQLYTLACHVAQKANFHANNVRVPDPKSAAVWHARLGHANYQAFEKVH